MIRGLLVPPDGEGRLQLVHLPTDDNLAAMRELIGGWAELIVVRDLNRTPRAWLWCDEDGQVKGRPVNGAASVLAGRRIVGTVVVTGPGDGADVPSELIPEGLT